MVKMLPFPHLEGKILADVSSFGIGGPARYFAEAKTIEEMALMLSYSYQHSLPVMILGKGSNTLFDDRGYAGLVILNRLDYIHQEEMTFNVGGGFSFARLGGITARQGLTGLEFASGIPATVGGCIYMNAGANGQETKDCLKSVLYINEKGEKVTYKKENIEFGYRTSSFQKWRGAIVEAEFELHLSDVAKKKQKDLLEYRLKTQPYKDKSAGCAFRNPPGMAAGKLIDECGWKEKRVGGAGVSSLHANFIINCGGAKASDILDLVQKIKEQVYKEKGILLEEEIRYIPYDVGGGRHKEDASSSPSGDF
jgi:UDP-N-acetylmuramate dehydrogenase